MNVESVWLKRFTRPHNIMDASKNPVATRYKASSYLQEKLTRCSDWLEKAQDSGEERRSSEGSLLARSEQDYRL